MAKKYITFSFDDGVTQDGRLIELFNKYGLKGTFNLNSALFGLKGGWDIGGKWISHNKVSPLIVKDLYVGHEVAVHTLSHPNLTGESDEAVEYQVEEIAEIKRLCDKAEKIELLPYHAMGEHKFLALGREVPIFLPPTEEHINKLRELIR